MSKKKEKGNTGFRNGKLFCFNCGKSFDQQLPQTVTFASAVMIAFADDHENCQPTWKEPLNDTELKSEEQNANWWAMNGEHGLSSKAMFNQLCKPGIKKLPLGVYQLASHPHDPDDFKRCYKLLQAVPQWKERLSELKELSPVWERLVDNWDKLTAMYEQNVAEEWKNYEKVGMYEFMETIIKAPNAT